ncbi:GNAT family N-acetyltransferase [Paenibacillus sp. IHBB 10380]|uniref:GNAT family N-acetyltransferase n=1 Tax=Paenibacillus sp. IHBB 10380 TaxID=1566358 RepID=UPI0005CFCD38|nr:acetoin utilization protein [Paenibacillus sp. IHBB 10380]
MKHPKYYHVHPLPWRDSCLIIEGPIAPERLAELSMHPDLDAFRPPSEQHKALIEIANLPEGRIIITRDEQTIVGYVTFHYADEQERWSQEHMIDLIELGAIEVADDYRSLGIGQKMITTAFEDNQMEQYIVFTTEYYWHWDLKGSGLSVWDYRKMMEKLMKIVDMEWYATDDPEICSHPANCLMVRMGRDVPLSSKEQFDHIRFQQRFMY